jgi:hypothetical protein
VSTMVQPEDLSCSAALSVMSGLSGLGGEFRSCRSCGHFINGRRVVVKRDDPAI